tara:strand:+ start:3514 stop:3660 length:147 start_codon:yes stop_codon:yes gene_type:complete
MSTVLIRAMHDQSMLFAYCWKGGEAVSEVEEGSNREDYAIAQNDNPCS